VSVFRLIMDYIMMVDLRTSIINHHTTPLIHPLPTWWNGFKTNSTHDPVEKEEKRII